MIGGILIDRPRNFSGARAWSHLWHEENDMAALHAFAAAIGMKREWFQDRKDFPHYDVCSQRKITAAVRLGARLSTLREWIIRRGIV